MFHHLLLKLSLTELTDVLESGTDLAGFLSELFTFLIGLAAVLSMLMIVYGGFLYMTAGATGKVNDAKEKIKNAILGLVLALSSYLILSFINPGLVELNLPSFDELDEPTFSGFTFPGQGPGTMYTGGICDISKDCIPGNHCCFVERDKEGNVIYENDSPIEKDCDETFALQEPSIKKSSQFASSFLTLTALAQDKDEENKICTPVGGGIRGEECEDSDEKQECIGELANCNSTDPRLSCIGPTHGSKEWQPFRKRGEQCWADSDCETENCLEYNSQYKICADQGATKEDVDPISLKKSKAILGSRQSRLFKTKNVPVDIQYAPLPNQEGEDNVIFIIDGTRVKDEIKEKFGLATDKGLGQLCTKPEPKAEDKIIRYPIHSDGEKISDKTKVIEIGYAEDCHTDLGDNWGRLRWGTDEKEPVWENGEAKTVCGFYFGNKKPDKQECCGQFLYCAYLKNPCSEEDGWKKAHPESCKFNTEQGSGYTCCVKNLEIGLDQDQKKFEELCLHGKLSYLDKPSCLEIQREYEEDDPMRQQGTCYDYCKSQHEME